jgi:acyl-CoA thioester hydrolase
MSGYTQSLQVRWSDLDPNFHVRHSVYYDWGAFARIALLTEAGLTPAVMLQHHIGPILFREECVFKKEIRYNDTLEINLRMAKSTRDGGRWTFIHEIWKNGDTLCCVLTVDGAWIDTHARKLTILPETFRQSFENIPRTEDFTWAEKQ